MLFGLGLLLAAAVGVWFYENASIRRLRRDYLPWMERLGRWRDGCEAARKALRERSQTQGEPAGLVPLRAWAWKGLQRIGYVDFPRREARPRSRGNP